MMQPNYDTRINAKTVGEVLLKSRGFFTEPYWFWICIGALLGFTVLFNFCYIIALMYLNRKCSHFELSDYSEQESFLVDKILKFFLVALGNSKATTVVEEGKDKHKGSHSGTGGEIFYLFNSAAFSLWLF